MILVIPGERNEIQRSTAFTKIYTVRAPRSPLADGRYRIILSLSYLPPWFGTVSRIIRDEKPDLVEICDKYTLNWMGGLLRKGFIPGIRMPVLIGLTCERMDDNVSVFIHSGRSARKFCQYYLGYNYIPMFDHHIAISHYTAEELKTAMIRKHQRPIWIQPLGVDTLPRINSFSTKDFRNLLLKELQLKQSSRLLLYAGRVSPEKNIPLLIEMMEELTASASSEYYLIVAGDGPRMPWLKEESEKRVPGRIKCLGHINDKTYLASLYSHCDAFIHPNPREPFGIAPLEAMVYRLPLVIPNAGGVLTYASPDNSWIANPDGQSFAAAVRSIFNNLEIRNEKIRHAHRLPEKFQWPRITRNLFDLYDRLYNQQTPFPVQP